MTSKTNFPSLGNNFKRKRQSIDVARQQNYNLDFLMPNYEDELALHPKKLEELKQWLITKMSVVRGNKMLLLTGPSGSGKKTAVKVICSELGIEVTEWDWEDEYGLDQFRERVIRRPSLTSFVQFLQDGEFTSIQRMTLKHRLLLISQLPSTLLREKKYLHEILTAIGPRSRCMIVFVLPNVDACWELSPVRIFPPSIMDALGISHIKFNSISPTFLTGAVKRAIKMLNITHLGAEDIRSISSSANGNIWQAMNSLLFLKNGRKTVSTDFTSKRPRRLENGRSHALASSFAGSSSSSSSAASLKLALASMPEQLELFHFIGKVLYAKRAEKSSEAWNRVEAKLNPQVWSKIALPLPPKDELNGLIDRSPLSAQMLAGFVFENEPHFAPSVQAAARMANTMAQLDGMVESNFEQRSTMEKYMLDLTIRGSILHNYRSHLAANPKRRFYQFEKPKFREIDEQRRENRLRIAQLFPTERSSEAALLNLPTISRIQSICVHRSQYELLKRLSLSQQSNHFRVQLMNNTASGIGQPLQLESDPEFISELAILEEADEGTAPLSPNASMDSFYSISSNITEMEQQNDGFNYDIEEVDDEVDEEARMEL